MERCIGSKPKAIRTVNSTTFRVEVGSIEQSTAQLNITEINGIDAEITVNITFHKIKGLVCIYEYNMCGFQEFQSRLKEQYGLHEIVEATWIKTKRNNNARPLLLTFCRELPQYIDVPGEIVRTKVFEYKQRPLMCRKCLEYGHGKNHCEGKQRCGKCSGEGHEISECTDEAVKCYHWGQHHGASA